jgi:hypothetical protein
MSPLEVTVPPDMDLLTPMTLNKHYLPGAPRWRGLCIAKDGARRKCETAGNLERETQWEDR